MDYETQEGKINSKMNEFDGRLKTIQARLDVLEVPEWRKITTWVSIAALAISASIAAFTVWNELETGLKSDQDQLSNIVSQLTEIDLAQAELLASTENIAATRNAGISLSNQRVVLLHAADRVVERLDDTVSPQELAILGAAYYQSSQLDRAQFYWELLARKARTRSDKASAWRSLGNLYFIKGEAHVADARSAFSEAFDALKNPESLYDVNGSIEILNQWAANEAAHGNSQQALEVIKKGEALLEVLPCYPSRVYAVSSMAQTLESVALVDAAGRPLLMKLRQRELSRCPALFAQPSPGPRR